MRSSLLIFIFLYSPLIYSQGIKQEKEKHIREDQIPDKINEILSSILNDAKKVKYYQETDGDHDSYEVKFLLYENRYSVEFSNDSKLEDVEVIVSINSLNEVVKSNLNKYFDAFDKYNIVKIQEQFQSDSISDLKVIKSVIEKENKIAPNYEIIAHVKENRKWQTFEILFDNDGNEISKRLVAKRSSDFILY